jgi:hypothetical protein
MGRTEKEAMTMAKFGFSKAIAGSIVAGALTLTSLVGGVASADGDTDGRDFLTWQRSYGATASASSDGDVDGRDFLVWQRNTGGSVGGSDLADWQANYGVGASASTVEPDPEYRYVPVRR